MIHCDYPQAAEKRADAYEESRRSSCSPSTSERGNTSSDCGVYTTCHGVVDWRLHVRRPCHLAWSCSSCFGPTKHATASCCSHYFSRQSPSARNYTHL